MMLNPRYSFYLELLLITYRHATYKRLRETGAIVCGRFVCVPMLCIAVLSVRITVSQNKYTQDVPRGHGQGEAVHQGFHA